MEKYSELKIKLILWSVVLFTVFLGVSLSAFVHAYENPVVWLHDDSIASVKLDSGREGTDSYWVSNSLESTVTQQGLAVSFHRLETSDQRFRILCAKAPIETDEGYTEEASCHVEINFYQSVKPEEKQNGPILLIQNKQDALGLSKILETSGQNEQMLTFRASSQNLCLQCNKSSSNPICAVSLASDGQSCNFLPELQASGTNNRILPFKASPLIRGTAL